MPHQLFLSHDSRDREKADAITRAIKRMTLGQIGVWHSSDTTGSGGLKPGNLWLDEIRAQIAISRAIVVLITPTSITRPWLLFESGFGAAIPDCDVIPVCVGIDEVPAPLASYQRYQLSDYDSLKRFAEKLLARYEVQFDEELMRPVLLEAVKRLSQQHGQKTAPAVSQHDLGLAKAVSELKDYFDKRFIGLISATATGGATPSEPQFYTVPVDLKMNLKIDQFIEVGDQTTVEDVIDNIYYMLNGKVEPYTYLQKWMLREVESGLNVVIREIEALIPAKVVFTLGSKWEVVWLRRPYDATSDL